MGTLRCIQGHLGIKIVQPLIVFLEVYRNTGCMFLCETIICNDFLYKSCFSSLVEMLGLHFIALISMCIIVKLSIEIVGGHLSV
ncbi:hypothetical protein GDO81_000986 [Engystomops pustulosus]|uniref:Uncharacterized protein n=1 Tax=Engystomops pustulosus TaxID=76066 RepID=A0AAV7DCV6_ENGPU|nr:hypothetical protein GDO81_000986 [Engystomops pustulosus]